jgi:hypothetical protein
MLKKLGNLELRKSSEIGFSSIFNWFAFFLAAAAMTLFSSSRAVAQGSSDSSQRQQTQVNTQQEPAQSQSDQRRVISKDTIQQNNPDAEDSDDTDEAAPQQRTPSPNRRPYPPGRATASVPDAITIPAGKVLFVRLNEPLSSDHSHAGDTFTATLDQPIVIDGWVVARRGETIVGTVTNAKKAGRVKGVSQLGLELTDLTVVDGQQLPVVTELWNGSAGTSHGTDAAGIATTTGVGTIIGAAADGGAGAGIGAGAGAAAGIAMVLLTRGKPTVLGPEARLSFRLKEPLTIPTENGRQAFLPVGPNDYNPSPSLRRRGDAYPVAYPPYYAACGPYWGCSPYYGYWGPSVGFYGGYYGFGHGFGHRGFRR